MIHDDRCFQIINLNQPLIQLFIIEAEEAETFLKYRRRKILCINTFIGRHSWSFRLTVFSDVLFICCFPYVRLLFKQTVHLPFSFVSGSGSCLQVFQLDNKIYISVFRFSPFTNPCQLRFYIVFVVFDFAPVDQ